MYFGNSHFFHVGVCNVQFSLRQKIRSYSFVYTFHVEDKISIVDLPNSPLPEALDFIISIRMEFNYRSFFGNVFFFIRFSFALINGNHIRNTCLRIFICTLHSYVSQFTFFFHSLNEPSTQVMKHIDDEQYE